MAGRRQQTTTSPTDATTPGGPDFVHLHVHSEYSLLDGLARIPAMVSRAKELAMPALAITDHGAMYGVIDFYAEAKKAGIKPIVGCCLPGQPIYAEDGMKPIEQVRIGDRVLTHRGRFMPVVRTMTRDYSGTLYGIRAGQSNTVWLTAEHPVLVADRHEETPTWVRAENLRGGRASRKGGLQTWRTFAAFPRLGEPSPEILLVTDYLDKEVYHSGGGVVAREKVYGKYDRRIATSFPASLSITPEFCRFIGLYLSEGSLQYDARGRPAAVCFSFGAERDAAPIEFVQRYIQGAFGASARVYDRGPRHSVDVLCGNAVLARFLHGLCGAGAEHKHLPRFAWRLGHEQAAALVQGVAEGDGAWHRATGQITVRMISRDIVYGLRALLAKMGLFGKVTESRARGLPSRRPVYSISWTPDTSAAYRRYRLHPEFVMPPVKEVLTRHYDGPVHNLEVEEDNSYVTDIAVHNCEIYVAPRSMGQREAKVDDKNYHLTLLARDETGYHNLLKIVSRAHLDGFYYKPRADKDLLARHKDGLICLSGCMSGEVSRLLLEGQPAQARAAARWYADLFGKDSYYVEIQNQLLRDQVQLNQDLVALARELDLPLVATNDSHYVRPEDSRAHDVLLCIQTNAQVEQQTRMRLETNEFYLRSGAEMARALPDLPDALRNTIAIAEQVNLKLDFDRVQLPHFELPEGHTPLSYLKERVYEGLKWRYDTPTPEHYARADYELGVIERTGYPLYFLIVADYVRYARERGILAVPRGSVAGSLCIYALGICDVDPLRFRLMFERFLNEERIGMPDIDMDFADDRREEVIRYVQQKYGRDRVAQIITFGTMAAKAAVRDVGRALGMSYGEVDKVAKAIPFGNTIAEARESYELKQLLQESPKVEELLGLAEAVEGLARNASTHAAGVVIARDPLDEHVPLQKATKGEEGVITQWPMTVIEKVGMLKMDFLGLANLTILDRARRIIEERRPGFKLDLQHLPMDYDEPTGTARQTYDMLGEGHTTAVFQLESPPMRRCLKGLRPNRISDLLAIVALYRPGPMENIPAFTAAKNGQQAVTYLHPDLQPILEETYGICVYQDQVLQIVRAIAGFSWGEADVLRKAMGKKIAALMDEQREKFLKRTVERGYTQDFAQQLWAIIAPFAGYGFPKGHAAAYAVIAYQTAYLKANYPAEYMAAVLTAEAGNAVKVAEAVAECHRLGVAVRPPDVNRSGLGFTLEDDGAAAGTTAIRFGLSGVKNVGDGAIEMLLKARQDGDAFVDLADFCRRVDLRQLNKRAVESLIKAGAMAAFGDAAALLAGLDAAMALAQQHQRARLVGQTTLFDLLGGGEGDAALPAEPAFALPAVPAVERRQRLAWEKEMIGLYISEHPLRAVARALGARNTCPIAEITEEMAGQTVTLGGFIASLRLIPTKKGDLMAAVELEDMGGSAEVIVFPRTYQAQRELLKEDTIVLVTGKIEARDDRPKILCETVELFEAAEDEVDEPLRDLAPSGAQTAFPLDAGEAAAAELEGPAPGVLETVPPHDLVSVAAHPALATSVDVPAPAWPAPELPDTPTIAAAAVVVEEEVSLDVPFGEMPAAVAAGASTRHFVLDLMIERSAREDRDVNRLVRLNELLGRFPGHDKVVLRFLVNGRAGPALELNERVECCEPLLEELLKELGDQGVRVRVAGAGTAESSEISQEGRDEVVAALAGAVPGGDGSGATRAHWS